MHMNYMKPVDLDLEPDSHGYLGNGRRATSEVALARGRRRGVKGEREGQGGRGRNM